MNLRPSLLHLAITFALAASAFAQGTKADYERSAAIDRLTAGKTFRDRVEPHWMPGRNEFWYRNDLPGGKKEFVVVEAVKGERRVVEKPPSTPSDPLSELKPRPSR